MRARGRSAVDITEVGIDTGGDPYSILNYSGRFAVQDSDGYLYTQSSFHSVELAAGQIARGWVTFELSESAILVSVLARPYADVPRITIADLSQIEGGDMTSRTPPPVPTPPSSPVAIGTAVEVGGSSYTVNGILDPAPAGVLGVGGGKRLVAVDITQMGIDTGGDSHTPIYFAVQDSDGYVYTTGYVRSNVGPSFSSVELAAGQIARGWLSFELSESAMLVSVLAQLDIFGPRITIADLW